MDIWTRMHEQTDIRKLTPVSYRAFALWGRCPKRIQKEKERNQSKIDIGKVTEGQATQDYYNLAKGKA